jgi:hypothetical protein
MSDHVNKSASKKWTPVIMAINLPKMREKQTSETLWILKYTSDGWQSVSVLRWRGRKTPTQLGPLERTNFNHWTAPVRVKSQELQRAVYRQSALATSPLRPTTRIFIFQLNTCGYSPYVTSSLTRGYVCHLQLLLVRGSAVILRSESHGTHDYVLLSQIWDSPNLEGQVPVFISPRKRVAQLYSQALGSLFVASYVS